MDSINNVCRVCLSTDNLKWVFDRKLYSVQKMTLKNVILTITGVDILTEDTISQKICTKCYQTSIKMYRFRMRARKNNKILKERYSDMIKTASIEHEIPKTGVTIKKKLGTEMEIIEIKQPNYKIHPSVRNILKSFPQLILPFPWLTSNIEPCVILEKDTVANFLKEESKNKQISVSVSKPDHMITKETTSPESIATDPLHTSYVPIINIETDSEDDSFNKKITTKTSKVLDIASDKSNNGDSDYELSAIDNIMVNRKIRRHNDSEFSTDTSMKDCSSSGPLLKENTIYESEKGLCLDQSIPLLVCSICNSVHDNVKKLERHQLRHLRCQFCRSMFKTIRSMEIHIKSSCSIKNMMNYLPSVKLERIELNQRIRTKYPEAFIDYPVIPRLQLIPRSPNETSEHEVSGKNGKSVGCNVQYDDDVIELLSDDDTTLPPGNYVSKNTPLSIKGVVPVRNITQSKINSFFLPINSTATAKVSTAPSVMSTSSSVHSTTPPGSSAASSVDSVTSPVIPGRLSPTYIVEPDIRIENTVADRIIPGISDIESVRKILSDSTASKKERISQTELSSICVDESGGTIKLKHIRNLLISYRIPCLLKKGDFQAQYYYNSINSKPQQRNKLCLWNDLFPVDIQVVSESSNNEGSVQNRIPAVTTEVVTKSHSTPAISGNCGETMLDPSISSFSPVTNLQTYSRNNNFPTPVNNTSSGSSNVDVHYKVPSNSRIVSEDPCSKNMKHIQMYPKSTNITHLQSNSVEAKDPTSVQPEANTATLQTTPLSYFNEMSGPPNVNPFGNPDLVVPKTSHMVSHNYVSRVGNTDSTRSNLAVQNKVPDPMYNLVPITTASSSNNVGPAFGSIRVKSLRDLT